MARQIDRKLHESWRRRIERQQQGSLTVAQFCKREGVSTANFYVWKRRLLRGAAMPASSASTRRATSRPSSAQAASIAREQDRPFVQVPLTAPAASPWIEIVLAEGAVVRLPQQNLAALQTVLQSLGGPATSMSEVRRA